MSKILTVESCWNCPFLEGTDYSTTKPFCKRLRLSGSTDVLFRSCPLPDDNIFKKEIQNELTLSTKEIYKVEPEGKVFRR